MGSIPTLEVSPQKILTANTLDPNLLYFDDNI